MKSYLIENRQIRVFISSTFRDMQDERDYLMKRTFPKLRKFAAERDVTLTELDRFLSASSEIATDGFLRRKTSARTSLTVSRM